MTGEKWDEENGNEGKGGWHIFKLKWLMSMGSVGGAGMDQGCDEDGKMGRQGEVDV